MQILDTAQVAKMLGVPEGTLRYWRYQGIGPRSFRVGKHVKYRMGDIENWLEHQETTTARGGV